MSEEQDVVEQATEAEVGTEPGSLPGAEPELDVGAGAEAGAEAGEQTDPREMAYIIESVVFAAGSPVPVKDLAEILTLPGEKPPGVKEIRAAVRLLLDEYAPGRHGIVFHEVAGGFQFRTARENADFVRQVFKEKPARLGRAALETLAIVAYRQPATKAEIEAVRGVDADGALNSLLARRLIRIAGRKEAIGRPLLYATTPEFLEAFGLKDLRDLPTLDEIAPPVLEEDPDARQTEEDEEAGSAGDDGGAEAAAAADGDDGAGGSGVDDEGEEDGQEREEREERDAEARRLGGGGGDGAAAAGPFDPGSDEDGAQDGGPQDGEAVGHAAQGEGEGGLQPRGAQPPAADGSDGDEDEVDGVDEDEDADADDDPEASDDGRD